jgi:hypothetical protein
MPPLRAIASSRSWAQGSCSQYSTRRGRGELIDAIEDLARQRLDVLLLEHDGDGHDHREALGRALVVVLHREHGARAVAEQHHERRVVEELLVRAAHVEAAERLRVVVTVVCFVWMRKAP